MKFLHLFLLLEKFMTSWNHKIHYGFTKAAQDLTQSLTTSRYALVLILFCHQSLGFASLLPIGIRLSYIYLLIFINPLALEMEIQIVAHHLCKMWNQKC